MLALFDKRSIPKFPNIRHIPFQCTNSLFHKFLALESSCHTIITQIIVYYMFTKPYEKKKAEIEAKKEAVFKKSGKLATEGAANGEGSGKGKKNKKH